jgi:protein-S-isoprenylcysteine O-methyltransferase Ste14
LDFRFEWSPPLPLAVHVVSLAVILLGYAFSTWAMIANRFFSGTVRIQTERGHTTVTDGPYRIVRHPGYAGAVIAYLVTPFALGTLWALVPTGLTVILYVVRTALEDRTLQEELPGYAEYAKKTRFRLVPGIW